MQAHQHQCLRCDPTILTGIRDGQMSDRDGLRKLNLGHRDRGGQPLECHEFLLADGNQPRRGTAHSMP